MSKVQTIEKEPVAAIFPGLSEIEPAVRSMSEVLLANLIMIGEIPAPTFREHNRIKFLIDRFREADLDEQSIDETGNGIGILKGTVGEKNILVVAHADTAVDENVDHTIQVSTDRVTGPGVADNSMGLAAVALLPHLLEKLDIRLKNNLILMGATRSLGRGNLEGLRFFLSNYNKPIIAGLGIEGVELGRLSHTSIGMKRGEITCSVPREYDWSQFGESSAILTLNEIINRINGIRTAQRPRTSIVMGSVRGGNAYGTPARNATLRFEIRSESSEIVSDLHLTLKEIVSEVTAKSGDTVELDIFAERQPGGIHGSHPLLRNVSLIMEELGIASHPGPSTSELSAFIDREIPAITLGVTEGERLYEKNESVKIEPMYKGIAQVMGTILAIDGGYCEES